MPILFLKYRTRPDRLSYYKCWTACFTEILMDRGLSKKCQIHLRNSLSSKRSRNTLQKVGTFLKKGLTALHYLEQKRYGRKKAELSEEDQALMQEDLDKIGVWMSSKLGFLLPFLAPCAPFTAWEMEVLSQKKSFLEKEKERSVGIQKLEFGCHQR